MPYVVEFTENLNGPSASNGWALASDHDHVTYPAMTTWVDSGSPDPYLGGFVLFGAWGDGGPATRSLWHEKVFTGLQPGVTVGVHLHAAWGLNTGPGSVFLSIEGGDGSNLVELAPDDVTFDLWTIPENPYPNVRDNVLAGIADVNGEVKVKYGGKGYGGSCNLTVSFAGVIEVVRFVPNAKYGYVMQHHA